jgi:hypothetical protein
MTTPDLQPLAQQAEKWLYSTWGQTTSSRPGQSDVKRSARDQCEVSSSDTVACLVPGASLQSLESARVLDIVYRSDLRGRGSFCNADFVGSLAV